MGTADETAASCPSMLEMAGYRRSYLSSSRRASQTEEPWKLVFGPPDAPRHYLALGSILLLSFSEFGSPCSTGNAGKSSSVLTHLG